MHFWATTGTGWGSHSGEGHIQPKRLPVTAEEGDDVTYGEDVAETVVTETKAASSTAHWDPEFAPVDAGERDLQSLRNRCKSSLSSWQDPLCHMGAVCSLLQVHVCGLQPLFTYHSQEA